MPARHDRVDDPAIVADLRMARRGQAYFSRALTTLSIRELGEPSRLEGWTRAHVAAHVGLNARALANLVQWASTGIETPMYASAARRDADIALAATLPAHALRHLDAHAAVHLSVEWRDLAPEAWSHPVRTAQGRTVPASATAWMRAREVWMHAIDLDAGARVAELPDDVLERLLLDVAQSWTRRGVDAIELVVDDAPLRATTHADGVRTVRGPLSALVRWATGRGTTRADALDLQPPRWL